MLENGHKKAPGLPGLGRGQGCLLLGIEPFARQDNVGILEGFEDR